MDVQDIPMLAPATIKVSKEGKSAIFDTQVVQVTDNKYIYTMPVRYDEKLVNFAGNGMAREIKVQINPEDVYVWKNISITKFVEDKKNYLRITTRTPGTKVMKKNKK